jgi:hypothetical protein
MTAKVRVDRTPPGQDPVYMPPNKGPFKCSNCEYYPAPNECNKEEMIKVQKAKGNATVQPEGCCNYFEKM